MIEQEIKTLIIDVCYMKIYQQIKNTPYFVYIVLLIEIAIIALYFLLQLKDLKARLSQQVLLI